MQLLKRPFVRTILRYGALFLAVYIGYLIYAMDRNPPTLNVFTIDHQVLDPAKGESSFHFEGVITDERSVSKAQFICKHNEEDVFVIVLVTSGANKYKVGFGKINNSPDWLGSWDGNKQSVTFQGYGRLPKGTEPLSCDWYAQLGDNLGNQTEFKTELSLQVLNRFDG